MLGEDLFPPFIETEDKESVVSSLFPDVDLGTCFSFEARTNAHSSLHAEFDFDFEQFFAPYDGEDKATTLSSEQPVVSAVEKNSQLEEIKTEPVHEVKKATTDQINATNLFTFIEGSVSHRTRSKTSAKAQTPAKKIIPKSIDALDKDNIINALTQENEILKAEIQKLKKELSDSKATIEELKQAANDDGEIDVEISAPRSTLHIQYSPNKKQNGKNGARDKRSVAVRTKLKV